MHVVNRRVWFFLTILSVFLFSGSLLKWIPIAPTEVLGFVSGAVCVLFVVDQNIWNFPVGIANNIFFIILFLSSRLYGDMALQGVYIILGFMGWWQWIYGGENRTALHVRRASIGELIVLGGIGAVATIGLQNHFVSIHDAAPFLDAVTTVLSLVAQYLLNGKRLENWFVWIIADVLYIGMYIQKELYLTALLYAVFIGMCIAGLASWKKAEQNRATKGSIQ